MYFIDYFNLHFRFLINICFWPGTEVWLDLDFGLSWSWHSLSCDVFDLPSLPTCPCWRPAAHGGSAGWVLTKPGWSPGRGARHGRGPVKPPWPGYAPGRPPCTPTGPDQSRCSPQRRSGHEDWSLAAERWPPSYGTIQCNLQRDMFREVRLIINSMV